MKKAILLLILIVIWHTATYAQVEAISSYTKKTYMILMRDGVKLFTVVLSPSNQTGLFPILIQRTPYGSDNQRKQDSTLTVKQFGSLESMARGVYIFVIQDIRGKFKS